MEVLLSAGADPDEELEPEPYDRGESPTLALRDAILNGSEEAVRLLLLYGADVGLVGKKGKTPALDLAKKIRHQGIVRLLEQHLHVKSQMYRLSGP